MSKPLLVFICAILLLTVGTLHAQVPGYMGRKSAIMVNLYGFPGGLGATSRSSYKYDGAAGNYLKHDWIASFDRVVSRRHVLSILAETYRMGSPNYDWKDAQGIRHEGHNRLNIYGTGIGLKTFPFLKRGWIAPIGPYVRFDWRISYVLSRFSPYSTPDITTNSRSRVANSFSIEPGYCGVIRGRVLVDVGMRFSLSSLFSFKGGGWTRGYNPVFWDSINMLYNDLLKLHLGFGVLLGK